ncbi:hypothetical protein WR25_21360 [Diploscapter pachys]|uniref:Uncharacterized protein n=1 Tax=Diploscapter pachys TaxID=2018661 RepID=A0A2A2M5W0_9BILA|nr:hypothetical protein WR25_21360 [Diploscapter pachys]
MARPIRQANGTNVGNHTPNSTASAARTQCSTPSGTRWPNSGATADTGGSSPSQSRKASCTSIISSSGRSSACSRLSSWRPMASASKL